MIFLKYIAAVVGKILLLPTVPFACVVVPMFYRAQLEMPLYTWGGIFGTFDNPVQGDRGFIAKHAPFINVTDGWRGGRRADGVTNLDYTGQVSSSPPSGNGGDGGTASSTPKMGNAGSTLCRGLVW